MKFTFVLDSPALALALISHPTWLQAVILFTGKLAIQSSPPKLYCLRSKMGLLHTNILIVAGSERSPWYESRFNVVPELAL